MKRKLIVLPIVVLALSACNIEYEITSDFNYVNTDVSIKDTLESTHGRKAHVVFLYGQSNAEGSTRISYLESKDYDKYLEYSEGYNNVFINFVNHNKYTSDYSFTKCVLGKGYTSELFGPEMGIAETMHNTFKDDLTFIVKWTWGGTSLRYDWLDNHERGKCYNLAMDFSLKCTDYLLSKGYDVQIDGICWMQGESDSWNADEYAYYRDTISFVSGLRRDLSKYQKDIKFIDAAINSDDNVWPYAKVINDAKLKFSNQSILNYLIDTNAIGITGRTEPEEDIDYAHYDSLSMVKLGQEFGKILADN
ncbi:MAG: sialate O-acetylesterase [Bacilli bacterium]|nr:sialate O-acetylesterase [Bacilli bacterium]